MRVFLNRALIVITLSAGLVSIFLFFGWIFLFFAYLTEISSRANGFVTAYANANLKAMLYLTRDFFAIIAGMFGWIALIFLCIYATRSWRNLPKWIPLGCLIGAATSLFGTFHFSLAVPPMLLALSLLTGVWFNDKPMPEDVR